MGTIKNWDDIQETQYIGSEGRYTLKVMEALKGQDGNYRQTTANGKEFHKYLCATKEGEQINVTLWLTDSAMWRYKRFVSACGVKTEGAFDLDSLPSTLVGKKFVAEVKKQPAKEDIVTGEIKESKYYEVATFHKIEE